MSDLKLDPPSPSMHAAVERIRAMRVDAAQAAPLDPLEAALARRANAADVAEARALDSDIHAEDVDAGGVPAEWVWADASDVTRTVLYLHGGAFVAGSSKHARHSNGLVTRASRTRFLSVNYRLAPEDPFPAGLDDVVTAYRWLLDAGQEPAHVAFGGTSAGGNLALAALHALRGSDLPLPRAVFTVCPLSDFTRRRSPAGQAVGGIAGLYIGDHDPADPHLSPALGEFSGLPPLHVECGTADALIHDNRALVEKAAATGVDVTLHETPGGIHSFVYLAPESPEAQAAVARVGAFLAHHLF